MNGSNTLDNSKLPAAITISCHSCSSNIRIRAYAQTRFIACRSCKKLHSIYEGKQELKSQFYVSLKHNPVIPVGSRGKIHDILFEVVGYVRWQEVGTDYFWSEYMLFNPVHGYAPLTEFNGHWNYIYQTYDYPHGETIVRDFQHSDAEYKLFLKYRAKAVFAEGEFHFNITDTDLPHYEEFICPPDMYIREKASKATYWYKGEYIGAAQVQQAFNISTPMPEKIGVGSTQPLSLGINFRTVLEVTLYFVALLTLIQFAFVFTAKEEVVFYKSFSLSNTTTTHTIVTPSFPIKGGILSKSNLEFNLDANVSNDWLGMNISLINDKTGEGFDFEEGVEFYDGYEGGEYWSEGSRKEDILLSAVPDGNYHLNIFVSKPVSKNYSIFSLEVKRDVPIWSNFFILLLIVSILCTIQWYREYSFDKDRWMNSDYSPYDHD